VFLGKFQRFGELQVAYRDPMGRKNLHTEILKRIKTLEEKKFSFSVTSAKIKIIWKKSRQAYFVPTTYLTIEDNPDGSCRCSFVFEASLTARSLLTFIKGFLFFGLFFSILIEFIFFVGGRGFLLEGVGFPLLAIILLLLAQVNLYVESGEIFITFRDAILGDGDVLIRELLL